MKAIVWTKYGPPDFLKLTEVEKPTPKDNEVLVRIYASTVTAADCEVRDFKTFSPFWLPLRLYIGLFKPTRIKILGQELAGDIEAVGKDVTLFKVGDPVFAASDIRLSTNAEYICLPENGMMSLKPANLSYDEAAAVPLGGPEAFQYLMNANIQAGQKVLIIGAGGTIGTFAVQLARLYGAEVTGVDSTEKLDMLRSIGADHVIDYTQEDFTKNGQTHDVIFDAPGKSSFSHCKGSLAQNGRYLSANPGWTEQIRTVWALITRPKKVLAGYANRRKAGLASLRELIEAGKIKPIIDRRYPLEQVADAHRYVETGHKKGNVVITIIPNEKT
ncbi:MAG TPA: NAD(P)-dependent alcohol dehydrogenase [Anaerolineales bacterium]|nr:NAD(P)-dependent alcohol dehydrogenase [Anaerolineales bacterium]